MNGIINAVVGIVREILAYFLFNALILKYLLLFFPGGRGSRAGKSETSDEWVDLEHSDEQQEILV